MKWFRFETNKEKGNRTYGVITPFAGFALAIEPAFRIGFSLDCAEPALRLSVGWLHLWIADNRESMGCDCPACKLREMLAKPENQGTVLAATLAEGELQGDIEPMTSVHELMGKLRQAAAEAREKFAGNEKAIKIADHLDDDAKAIEDAKDVTEAIRILEQRTSKRLFYKAMEEVEHMSIPRAREILAVMQEKHLELNLKCDETAQMVDALRARVGHDPLTTFGPSAIRL